MTTATLDTAAIELPDAQAAALFDKRARVLVGLSGAEFVALWRKGEFADTDDENIVHMTMLLPLVLDLPSTSPPQKPQRSATKLGVIIDDFVDKLRRGVSRQWQERIHTKP